MLNQLFKLSISITSIFVNCASDKYFAVISNAMILKFLSLIPCYMYLINTAITYRLYLRTKPGFKPTPYSKTYEPRILHTVWFDNKSNTILPESKNYGGAFKNQANFILLVHMNHNYCILEDHSYILTIEHSA